MLRIARIAGHLRSSYLLLLPSLWPEAMSYSVIQAMAHGKPVVAYDVGANSEAIVHGENWSTCPMGKC